MKSFKDINFIYDKDVNNISELNLTHNILNSSKHN